jgi:hypothetical protein
MEAADVECTHCGVVMTSWSSPGSPVRYYQCPFCTRTHSSHYAEVFRRGAGARYVEPRPTPELRTSAGGIPEATPEAAEWAGIKSSAARWFARLDAEERRLVGPAAAASRDQGARSRAPVTLLDPRDVVELRPMSRSRRSR